MEHFLKNLKPIAYLLASLILFQSCIVYKSKPTSIEEASKYNNRRIKIQTPRSDEYKLKWIEDNGEYIRSIKNTKRVFIDPNAVIEIKIFEPETRNISLDFALNYKGKVQFVTKDFTYNLIKIESRDTEIIGYYKTGLNDTVSVFIPKNQIMRINIENKAASFLTDISIIVVVAILIKKISEIDYKLWGL